MMSLAKRRLAPRSRRHFAPRITGIVPGLAFQFRNRANATSRATSSSGRWPLVQARGGELRTSVKGSGSVISQSLGKLCAMLNEGTPQRTGLPQLSAFPGRGVTRERQLSSHGVSQQVPAMAGRAGRDLGGGFLECLDQVSSRTSSPMTAGYCCRRAFHPILPTIVRE